MKRGTLYSQYVLFQSIILVRKSSQVLLDFAPLIEPNAVTAGHCSRFIVLFRIILPTFSRKKLSPQQQSPSPQTVIITQYTVRHLPPGVIRAVQSLAF